MQQVLLQQVVAKSINDQKLQELYKKGLLDKKEYEAKKAEILKEL